MMVVINLDGGAQTGETQYITGGYRKVQFNTEGKLLGIRRVHDESGKELNNEIVMLGFNSESGLFEQEKVLELPEESKVLHKVISKDGKFLVIDYQSRQVVVINMETLEISRDFKFEGGIDTREWGALTLLI